MERSSLASGLDPNPDSIKQVATKKQPKAQRQEATESEATGQKPAQIACCKIIPIIGVCNIRPLTYLISQSLMLLFCKGVARLQPIEAI